MLSLMCMYLSIIYWEYDNTGHEGLGEADMRQIQESGQEHISLYPAN